MSKRTDRITNKLILAGASWAVQAAKYVDPNDPLEYVYAHRATWHIHPDATYPHWQHVVRFDTLDELEEWLDFCHCPEDMATSVFSEDELLEWCNSCGKIIQDHHQRKFGVLYPNL